MYRYRHRALETNRQLKEGTLGLAWTSSKTGEEREDRRDCTKIIWDRGEMTEIERTKIERTEVKRSQRLRWTEMERGQRLRGNKQRKNGSSVDASSYEDRGQRTKKERIEV